MSDALFGVFKSHCIYCPHAESGTDPQSPNDAMERHYWDKHYSQGSRDMLRAAGQLPSRIGATP